MATQTAPITDKRARASQLRQDSFTLSEELTHAERKIETARRTLVSAESKRQNLTEAAALGHPPKQAEVAALDAEISTARVSVDGLTALVNSKRTALNALQAQQESLGREIAIEDQREARRARFDALAKQATEAADRVSEKLRSLIEHDLPEFDAARDALVNEFIGAFDTGTSPEITATRTLIHRLEGQFFDGSFLAVTRRLLRSGWVERGDIVFQIRNLRAPR